VGVDVFAGDAAVLLKDRASRVDFRGDYGEENLRVGLCCRGDFLGGFLGVPHLQGLRRLREGAQDWCQSAVGKGSRMLRLDGNKLAKR